MWINRRSSCCTTLIRNSCFNRYVTERACCLSKRQASSYARVLSDVSSIGMKRMEKTVYQLHLFLEDLFLYLHQSFLIRIKTISGQRLAAHFKQVVRMDRPLRNKYTEVEISHGGPCVCVHGLFAYTAPRL